MKIQLTSHEIQILKQIVEVQHEISNDTVVDDLYIRNTVESSVSISKIGEIRSNIGNRIDILMVLTKVLAICNVYQQGVDIDLTNKEKGILYNEIDLYIEMETDMLSNIINDFNELKKHVEFISDCMNVSKLFK